MGCCCDYVFAQASEPSLSEMGLGLGMKVFRLRKENYNGGF